jgi:glycosyltransferase involved in cell wall biosynthesis
MYKNCGNGHPAKPTIFFAIGSLGLGGAERQMALLIKQLTRLNFNCHLFALEPVGPLRDYLRTTALTVHSGGYCSEKLWIVKILLLIRAQYRMLGLIRKIRPDVIHSYLPLTNFMGSVAGRLLNVPGIITSKRALGTHQDRNLGWRIFDMASFRFSHQVTVNSNAVGEDTIKRDRGRASKIRLIYNGLDLEDFPAIKGRKQEIRKALHIDPKKKITITVANLIPYKGHIELLQAAETVAGQFSNTIFLLVGEDRGIQKDLEEQARVLGIRGKIIFLGQRKDVPDLLAASDISVLPSHEEGFSNVILESMAAGLPVIATRVGGNPEAIVDSETGWLVPPHSPDELAEKILDLLQNPEKAKNWGNAGRRRIQQHFSAEKMVGEHIKLYKLQRFQSSGFKAQGRTASDSEKG